MSRIKIDQFVLDPTMGNHGVIEVNYASDRDLYAQVHLRIYKGLDTAVLSLSLDELVDIVTMLKQFVDSFQTTDPFSDKPF